MALQGSDAIAISRAGTLYKIVGSDILAYVQSNVGTGEYKVANIAARNALNANMSLGDRVLVDDATGDVTVGTGWAIYVWVASNTWTKVAEQEGLDVVIGGTNLTYTSGAGNGIVVSDTGTDATIPLATGVIAGLQSPANFAKDNFLTVTAATDLDALRTASHAAVTTAGTAATNPITVTGQALNFSIANLTTAP
jgi:hypothetical protein